MSCHGSRLSAGLRAASHCTEIIQNAYVWQDANSARCSYSHVSHDAVVFYSFFFSANSVKQVMFSPCSHTRWTCYKFICTNLCQMVGHGDRTNVITNACRLAQCGSWQRGLTYSKGTYLNQFTKSSFSKLCCNILVSLWFLWSIHLVSLCFYPVWKYISTHFKLASCLHAFFVLGWQMNENQSVIKHILNFSDTGFKTIRRTCSLCRVAQPKKPLKASGYLPGQ